MKGFGINSLVSPTKSKLKEPSAKKGDGFQQKRGKVGDKTRPIGPQQKQNQIPMRSKSSPLLSSNYTPQPTLQSIAEVNEPVTYLRNKKANTMKPKRDYAKDKILFKKGEVKVIIKKRVKKQDKKPK